MSVVCPQVGPSAPSSDRKVSLKINVSRFDSFEIKIVEFTLSVSSNDQEMNVGLHLRLSCVETNREIKSPRVT